MRRPSLLALPRDALILVALIAISISALSPFLGAIWWLGIAVYFAGWSLLGRDDSSSPQWVTAYLIVALALTLVVAVPDLGSAVYWIAPTMALSAAVLTLVPGVSSLRIPMAFLMGALVAILLILNFTWAVGRIDVFDTTQRAAALALRGINPYPATYYTWIPNADQSQLVPSAVHYYYGPATFLLRLPTRMAGDVRLTAIAEFCVLFAAVIALSRRNRELHSNGKPYGLIMCLAFPLTVSMTVYGWVDIDTVAFFGLWLVLRHDARRFAVAALAIALLGKPTSILFALIPWLISSARARVEIVLAGVAATLLLLPIAAVTGFSNFFDAVVGTFTAWAPRWGSITLDSWLHSAGLPNAPFWVSLVAIGAASLIFLRRPRDTADALMEGALVTSVALFVSPWAYLNYFFCPAAMMLLAAASQGLPLDAQRPAKVARSAVAA